MHAMEYLRDRARWSTGGEAIMIISQIVYVFGYSTQSKKGIREDRTSTRQHTVQWDYHYYDWRHAAAGMRREKCR